LLLEPFVGLDWVHLEDVVDLAEQFAVVALERASARNLVGQIGNHCPPRLFGRKPNHVSRPHVEVGADVGEWMSVWHTFRPHTSKIVLTGATVGAQRVHGGFIHKMVETVKA
jgi:hypothetical protein